MKKVTSPVIARLCLLFIPLLVLYGCRDKTKPIVRLASENGSDLVKPTPIGYKITYSAKGGGAALTIFLDNGKKDVIENLDGGNTAAVISMIKYGGEYNSAEFTLEGKLPDSTHLNKLLCCDTQNLRK